MSAKWKSESYILGNYFQTELNFKFIQKFEKRISGSVLDVGCGDGAFIHQIASKRKRAKFKAIDSAASMIKHADEYWQRKNLDFETIAIESFYQPDKFDTVLSFWCLHWTNIYKSLPAIYASLKTGGRFYGIMSSFVNNSFRSIWQVICDKQLYPPLQTHLEKKLAVQSSLYYEVVKVLNSKNFKYVDIEIKQEHVTLPDLAHFRKLMSAMPFMNNFQVQTRVEFFDVMESVFIERCQKKYDGRFVYETRPIYIMAQK